MPFSTRLLDEPAPLELNALTTPSTCSERASPWPSLVSASPAEISGTSDPPPMNRSWYAGGVGGLTMVVYTAGAAFNDCARAASAPMSSTSPHRHNASRREESAPSFISQNAD